MRRSVSEVTKDLRCRHNTELTAAGIVAPMQVLRTLRSRCLLGGLSPKHPISRPPCAERNISWCKVPSQSPHVHLQSKMLRFTPNVALTEEVNYLGLSYQQVRYYNPCAVYRNKKRNSNNKHSRPLKTKKGAAKRFLRTGNRGLKRGHAGKRHNTGHLRTKTTRRLNQMVHMKGTWLKKMQHLVGLRK